jgi:hypothetical protein
VTTTAARLTFSYTGETGAEPSFPLTAISTAARKTRWVPPFPVLTFSSVRVRVSFSLPN